MSTDMIVQLCFIIAVAGVFLWFILWFPTRESERLGKPEWLTREHWQEDLGPVFRRRMRNLWILFLAVTALGLLHFAWLKLT